MNEKAYKAKCQRPLPPSPLPQTSQPMDSTMTSRYLSNLSFAPGIVKLITQNGLLEGCVKMASDFSYSAPSYAGSGYRIVGDAGGVLL